MSVVETNAAALFITRMPYNEHGFAGGIIKGLYAKPRPSSILVYYYNMVYQVENDSAWKMDIRAFILTNNSTDPKQS